MRVLIADSDSLARECISSCIDWKRYGFDNIYLAKNGLEALATAQVTPPDLVITEIAMPYIDGLELLDRLKEIRPDICTIVVSGTGDNRSMKSALHLGTFEYILKPVELNELRDAVYRAKTHIIETRISEGSPNIRIPRDMLVKPEEGCCCTTTSYLSWDALNSSAVFFR